MRPAYWLMTGGLSILTALALQKGDVNVGVYVKIFLSMACVVSGGFAVNDYFDQKADAIVKPNRPIPSGAVSSLHAVIVSAVLFILGLTVASFINSMSFGVLFVDALLLIFYSSVLKKRSGFLANVLVGGLIGTSFLYGEAATFNAISILSFSLSLSSFGSIGGNIMRDVLSLDGDVKAGYLTIPQEIGVVSSVKAGVIFLLLSALSSPLPYVLHAVGVGYLFPIAIWDGVIIYSALKLLRRQDTSNVKRQERFMTMAMIMLPISLIAGAYT
jgi:geranylgeranylglycerol-phosphate geranylgeranyltransferase